MRLFAAAVGMVALAMLGGCVTPNPLQAALQRDDTAALKGALDAGADVRARFADPAYTPLEYACRLNRFEALKILVERGALVSANAPAASAPTDGKRPRKARSYLATCIIHRRLDMIRYLVEHGAPVTARDLRLARTRPEVMTYFLSVRPSAAASSPGAEPPDDAESASPETPTQKDAPATAPAAKQWWEN